MRSVSWQARSIIAACVAMDRKFAETGAQTDHDSRTYLAWSNSLSGHVFLPCAHALLWISASSISGHLRHVIVQEEACQMLCIHLQEFAEVHARSDLSAGSPAEIKHAEALWGMLRAFVKIAAEDCDAAQGLITAARNTNS